MSIRFRSCVSVILVGMIGVAWAFGNSTALGAPDCATEPDRDPPEGNHWYYHVDRSTERKCWYLAAAMPPGTAVVQSPRRTSTPDLSQTGERKKSPPLSESEQASLFLEFLRWREKQRSDREIVEPSR